jgi:S-adenosylmethionine:tRNA ribosyltransferase-isomerase
MKTKDFDYVLDDSKIAKYPVEPRDESKLLLCLFSNPKNKSEFRLGEFENLKPSLLDCRFKDIIDFLTPNDVLVLNNAKVLPVRLLGKKEKTQGKVEILILKKILENECEALVGLSSKLKEGLVFNLGHDVFCEVIGLLGKNDESAYGVARLRFFGEGFEKLGLEKFCEQYGFMPLPPYIKRDESQKNFEIDKKNYQTVYAKNSGSAAAPTAGFHFTENLIQKLKEKKIEILELTLHVGLGTFRPIKAENIESHKMHEEIYEVNQDFYNDFLRVCNEGKRIIAVGTTVVRALESWARTIENSNFKKSYGDIKLPSAGIFSSSLYITPGFKFKVVDDLITNFHLPRSTLLVLVAAAMGYENMMMAYQHALKNDYRFFSYGDAMFIRGRSQ